MIKCRRKENPVFCVVDTHTQNGIISHIFGAANRKHSEEDGLVVDLCHACHNEPPDGVHFNKNMMQILHEFGQRKWMIDQIEKGMTAEEAKRAFMQRYGKNYL